MRRGSDSAGGGSDSELELLRVTVPLIRMEL